MPRCSAFNARIVASPTRCRPMRERPGTATSSAETIARTSAVMRASSQWASRPSSTETCTATPLPSGRGGNIGPDTGVRLVGRGPGSAGGRIGDPRVVDAGEQRHERLLDAGEIAQGEIAIVELAFFEALTDDAFDQV